MNILDQLNSPLLYVLCGGIILYIVGMCVVFLVRAYRAGIALGMDKTKLNRAITSSLTFSILPSVSILLGVIALSGTLGIPLPWLRLSVVGALHYETSVADVAARAVGLSGLRAEEMTTTAFTTIALVLSLGIMWSVLCTIFFNKRYTASLEKRAAKRKSGHGFGDEAMTAMFIGLITAYIGSYVDLTPRELVKLWITIREYILSSEPNSDLFRSLFTRGYFKEGWMGSGDLGGQLYHIGGVEGDTVYAIMTRYVYPDSRAWELRDALIDALS